MMSCFSILLTFLSTATLNSTIYEPGWIIHPSKGDSVYTWYIDKRYNKVEYLLIKQNDSEYKGFVKVKECKSTDEQIMNVYIQTRKKP